jgi:alpha-tubulin suppressor-like RCC1 family protein
MGHRPVVSVCFRLFPVLILLFALRATEALAAPEVSSFKINNGAATTANPAVTLPNACEDAASGTHTYMASESSDFTSATWQPYAPVPLFILSGGDGVKTVYFKVKDRFNAVSAVTSATITRVGSGASIMTWGVNDDGSNNVPLPNRDFVTVALGDYCKMGLKNDGLVVTWKSNGDEMSFPWIYRDVIAVAVGKNHYLALRSNGSIGSLGTANDPRQTQIPSPNSGFVAIATGESHNLGLKSDGSIAAWGDNTSGQCTVSLPNRDFVAVAVGKSHSLGLKANGSIVAWGSNTSGQCLIPSPNMGYMAIAAGESHSLGLKSNGSIVAWGNKASGRCSIPEPNSDFVAVGAGILHSLGLKSDGSIVAWGDNTYNQGNIPQPNIGFVALATAGYNSMALASSNRLQVTLTPPEAVVAGAQWRMTSETEGVWHKSEAVARGNGSETLTFKEIYGWVKPADQQVELTTGGLVFTTGNYTRYNWKLSTECSNGSVRVTPAVEGYPHESTVTLTAQPDPNYWFDHWEGDVPEGLERINPLVVTMDADKTVVAQMGFGPLPPAPVISAFSINNGMALTANPAVTLPNTCVGETSASAAQYLASESPDFTSATWRAYRSVPLFSLSGGSGMKTVYFKVKNSAEVESAITSDTIMLGGSGFPVTAWGENADGRCTVRSPNSGYMAVAGGGFHSLGLRANGSVAGWGANTFGECTLPGPNTGFVAVAAGTFYSVGLKANGSIVTWGVSKNGPTPNRDFVAIAAEGSHCLGLKSNGSIVAWGDNEFGQCSVPTPNCDFVAVATEETYSLGLKSNGSIVTWGLVPGEVPWPNRDFVAVAAGNLFSLGLKSDGSIIAWGVNERGQCDVPSPNRDSVAISAGWHHGMGLKADGSIVVWGEIIKENRSVLATPPSPNRGIVAFDAGGNHSLVIRADGNLEVNLTPPQAIAAGAQWRLTDEAVGVWHDAVVSDPVSHTTSSFVLKFGVGSHTLTFKEIVGWTKPPDQKVVLTIEGTTRATGEYKQIMRTLSTGAEHGTIQTSPAGNTFPHGTTATLTATPVPGFVFAGWTGDIVTDQKGMNPLVLMMDCDRQVTANFLTAGQSTVTLTLETEGQGSVAVDPDLMFYAVGTTVTLTALPAPGYRFVRWEGDVAEGDAKKNPLTLTMERNGVVRAVFERIPAVPMWLISRSDGGKAMGGS